ncbi:STAS domain-containing protein [bacterium]|nr:STAS domain-containing protein [bacterium]MCI0602069.1 STAS domain-containing protein [bacterium]
MEIRKQQKGDVVEFKIDGRLDAYWSDHLSGEVGSAIRAGIHHVRLDLSDLTYISSAGIRVLLNFYQQLKAIQGSLIVVRISEPARAVLDLAGLLQFLSPAEAVTSALQMPGKLLERGNATYEFFSLKESAVLRCKILGDPSLLEGCRYDESHARKVALSPSTFGLGLGAFGGGYQECRDRFGEFLAVSGTAVYLPTDGTNVADYLVSSGKFVPELTILYGLFCEGNWRNLVRFQARGESGSVKLSEIVSFALEFTKKESLAMVIVSETAGLVGAALSKPPVGSVSASAPYHYPDTVEWLSFTAERAHAKSLTLVCGVITKGREAASILRWMDQTEKVAGHFHAAAFPYSPLKKGRIDMAETVSRLFESNRVEGVLHLIQDDREISGVGESEFVRGACWVSPITEFLEER